MVDIVTRSGKGSPLTNAEVDANFTNLAEVAGVTGEPMGIEDATQSTISFNAGTRTFTIAPVSSSFVVWCRGKKIVVTSSQTVTIPNTTGLYSIHYNADGTLDAKAGHFVFSTDTPVAYLYWNATTGTAPYFADERHGVILDWQTHEYLHRTRGAALASGFVASGYTTSGNGSVDSDAQLTLEGGTFFDEDMKIVVVATDTPVPGTWQQDLLSPAKIPVFHLQGDAWVMDAPTDFPFKQGTSRPQYNAFSGGVWSTADVTNNKYATTWLLATNNLTYPVIAIIGQGESDSQGAAEAFDFANLQLPGFPSVEFRPLYKLVFHCADSFTNSVNAKLVAVTDIRNIQSAGASAALTADHGNLSGLSDDDHQQYLHVDVPRLMSDGVKASFLPPQTGNSGKFLQTNGTVSSWGTLSSANVTTALGFTPYNATNPSGYVNTAGARAAISVTGAGTYDSATGVINIVGGVVSVAGKTGVVVLNSSDVGLGNVENKSSATIRSELTSLNVTTALGFTPYNATNPAGYISGNQNITLSGDLSGAGTTGIVASLVNSGVTAGTYTNATVTVDAKGRVTSASNGIAGGVSSFNSRTGVVTLSSADVTTALGFTPYNATNPSGYITSSGSITGFAGSLLVSDTRSTGTGPSSGQGVRFDFKSNSTDGLSDGGIYHGVMTFQQWTDSSGGGTRQLGFTDNDNLWIRGSGSALSAYGSWKLLLNSSNYSSYALPLSGGTLTGGLQVGYGGGDLTIRASAANDLGDLVWADYTGTEKHRLWDGSTGLLYRNNGGTGNLLLHAGNYNSYAPTLTGGGASGTWGINVSGNAATVSSITSNTQLLRNSLSAGVIDSLTTSNFRTTLFGSATSGYQISTARWNSTPAGIGLSSYGTMLAWAGSDTHGFLALNYNGAGAVIGGGNADNLNWQATLLHSSNYGDYTLKSRGIVDNIDFNTYGNYVTNIVSGYIGASANAPTSYSYAYGTTISFNAGPGQAQFYVSHAGNDLCFRGGWNGGSWQTWNKVLTNQNYSSYSPSLTGSGASGTWGISITGNAGNASSISNAVGGSYSWTGSQQFQSNLGGMSGGLNTPPLQVYATGGNSAFMSFHRSGIYAVNMGLDSDNVIRIGGWSASANRWQLDMSGNGTYAGNVTAYSDERLKKDWAPLAPDYVSRLALVKSGTYTRIDSGERQAGSSAQDWQLLLPEVVSEGSDEDKTLSLAYGNAALVSAVELAKDNVELRARIERLESLINKLIGD